MVNYKSLKKLDLDTLDEQNWNYFKGKSNANDSISTI